MEKGKLLYENPKNSRIRVFLSILWTVYVWGMILYLVGMLPVLVYSGRLSPTPGWYLKFIILILALVAGDILMVDYILIPRFKIYESGITLPISGIHIFGKKEGEFIPYRKIKAYEKYKFKKGYRCKVYFDDRFEIYTDIREGVTDTLVEHLKMHGIRQMPENCPYCNTKLYTYTEICPRCGRKIFPEEENI